MVHYTHINNNYISKILVLLFYLAYKLKSTGCNCLSHCYTIPATSSFIDKMCNTSVVAASFNSTAAPVNQYGEPRTQTQHTATNSRANFHRFTITLIFGKHRLSFTLAYLFDEQPGGMK